MGVCCSAVSTMNDADSAPAINQNLVTKDETSGSGQQIGELHDGN